MLPTIRARLAAVTVALGLVACSPIASFRPASGIMPGRKLEVGAGAAVVTPRPYVIEEQRAVGQLWVSGDLSRVANASGIVAFDDQAAAVGGALRLSYVRADRFAGGVEAELGYAWGAVSLPVAVRVVDQTWIYAAPRLGTWGIDRIYGTNVGASVRVMDGVMLRAEWQRSWQDFKYYNKRDHYGGALAYQF